MKEAISMYLGGFVIKADDCNYDSAKQWGLKCPCKANEEFNGEETS